MTIKTRRDSSNEPIYRILARAPLELPKLQQDTQWPWNSNRKPTHHLQQARIQSRLRSRFMQSKHALFTTAGRMATLPLGALCKWKIAMPFRYCILLSYLPCHRHSQSRRGNLQYSQLCAHSIRMRYAGNPGWGGKNGGSG